MDIAFYSISAPDNALDKLTSATLIQDYSGPATIDVSDLNPTLLLENGGGSALRTANYAYITDFGRAYFIEEQIATTAENIFAYKLRLDPLESFSSSILDLEVVVERQTDNKDMGRVMKEMQTRTEGRAPGKLLSQLVGSRLN